MAYRNLTFRSLATDIRRETYLGEEHIVIPCIALVGNEVVYGMNAEGPEFIPAEELEFSTLGWSGRPVLYDHPPNSTSTANDPAILEAMSFGQIFHPTFSDNKLKVEAWCSRSRAIEIGQEDLITSIENGDVIELSIGAIISLEHKSGIAPNGKKFTAIWHDVQSDHLAIGLSGSQGACNIEMGCGANRVLKANNDDTDTDTYTDDARSMRAMRGVNDMPEARTTTKTKSNGKPALPALDIKPRSLKQRILSLASQAFQSLAEDAGLSDKELRDKLWDQLYAVEPAFYGIENVYQESMTVTYITSPDKKLHMWRRSFVSTDNGAVTINDDREEVAVTDFYYIYMGENPTTTAATLSNPLRKPRNSSEGISFESIKDWLRAELSKLETGASWLYVEDIYESSVVYSVHFDNAPSRLYERSYTLDGEVVTITSDRVEVKRKAVEYEPVVRAETRANCGCQMVSANGNDNDPANPKEDTDMPDDPNKPKTDAATTQPAASPPATTPTPATATVEDPKPADTATTTAPSTSTTPATVTPEMLNAALEAHPLVKHYRAQEAKEKASLITALGKKQKIFTVEQLTAMSLDQIRPIAELAGVGVEMSAASAVVAGDYSGRMMANGTDTDDAEVEVPKPWTAALKARDKTTN